MRRLNRKGVEIYQIALTILALFLMIWFIIHYGPRIFKGLGLG